MNKTIIRISSVLFILSSLFYILITSVFGQALDVDFYVKEYHKYDLQEYVGLDETDYRDGMYRLIGYCKGQSDSIQTSATINGKYSETLFNQREVDHMVDVKALAQGVDTLQNVSFIIMIVSALFLLFGKDKFYFKTYWQASKVTYLMIIGLFIGLIIMVLVDFNSFWTTFHHVFFPNNDLWLLNPSTDIMIRMLPGEIFNDLVLNIAYLFFIPFCLVSALMYQLIKKKANYIKVNRN